MLHNLIIDHREEMKVQGLHVDDKMDTTGLLHHFDSFMLDNPCEDLGIIHDNSRPPGRLRGR